MDEDLPTDVTLTVEPTEIRAGSLAVVTFQVADLTADTMMSARIQVRAPEDDHWEPLLVHSSGSLFSGAMVFPSKGTWTVAFHGEAPSLPSPLEETFELEILARRADFELDVLPLFTEDNAWSEGSAGCAARGCHHKPGQYPEDSAHDLDMGSYEGILLGADLGEEKIVFTGQDETQPDYWKESPLRKRLRNNRMPLGIPTTVPRNGPSVQSVAPIVGWTAPFTSDDPSGIVKIVEAWLEAGAPDGTFPYAYKLDETAPEIALEKSFDEDVKPLFVMSNVWFPGAAACNSGGCHNGSGGSHDLDMGTYEGILLGADDGDEKIVFTGQDPAQPDFWEGSPLRKRLRNNRMPWGITPAVPRDGPNDELQLIDDWLAAGAPNGSFDTDYLGPTEAVDAGHGH